MKLPGVGDGSYGHLGAGAGAGGRLGGGPSIRSSSGGQDEAIDGIIQGLLYIVQFPIAFFSLFGDFSGKGEVFQKWFSQWTTTSKRFHPKIPTRSKVMAVLKWGTSGAIYFLSTWFQRVFMTLLLLSPEKGVGNKKI